MIKDIYLDNAATTYPKPDLVYRAMDSFAREVGGSPGRSGHERALESGREVLRAREVLAKLLGVGDSSRIIFTKNATESLNLAIKGVVKPGGHVIISSLEHNSVLRPIASLKQEWGVEYTVVPCRKDGSLDLDALASSIRPNTQLLVFTHASNVVGTLMPLGKLVEIANKNNLPLLVDAAQTAGRYPLNVEEEGIQLLAFTGHKELFGPQGTGGLYISPELDLHPLMEGGTGSDSESAHQPYFLPDRYESGTLNAFGIAGLRAGVEYIMGEGLEKIREHEKVLTQHLLEGLTKLHNVKLYGSTDWDRRVGIVSFNVEGYSSAETASILNEKYRIAVRGGLHCSPLAHQTIGTLGRGTVRVGLSYLNTMDDVDCLLDAIKDFA